MRNIYAWIKNDRGTTNTLGSNDVLEIEIHYKSIMGIGIVKDIRKCVSKPFVTIRIKHTRDGHKPIIETKYH